MRKVIATLRSISPYSQSRPHTEPKLSGETADAHEKRTWREKCHVDDKGHIIIPPMAFKQAMDSTAQKMGIQVPGKGKATYTKFFVSGLMCIDPVALPDKKDSVRGELVYANADGRRGSGTRVWRTFPVVDSWKGDVVFHVLADEITPGIFEAVLIKCGTFTGIGRFRAENGGYFGRWKVEEIEWVDE
jgi:hypothetical protein